MLFVILGLEVIAVRVNSATLRKGLVAIVTVSVVRLAVVAACAGILYLVHRQRRTDIMTLSWGGLRGGLSIALALSIPPPRWPDPRSSAQPISSSCFPSLSRAAPCICS